MYMLPINKFYDDFFTDSRFFDSIKDNALTNINNSSSMMNMDIEETNDNYVLTMDVPGIKKENINIEIEDGIMRISATKDDSTEEKGNDGNFIRRERRFGSFSRSLSVSKDIQASDVSATCEDGVLKITIPKPQKQEKKSTNVQIN